MNASNPHRIYLHAITPLHAGTGQAADVVDLAIAREKATGWPVVPGSSLKGCLRGEFDESTARKYFGEPDANGPIAFTDLRILCLPVRSFFGTFAWVTAPLVMDRFVRDSKALGIAANFTRSPSIDRMDCIVSEGGALAKGEKVYLEDLDLTVAEGDAAGIAEELANEVFGDGKDDETKKARDEFVKRFAIVSNTVCDFLCETATEVSARIKLGKDGTTSGNGGNLWYEEAVPAEAIFAGWAVETGYNKDNAEDAWKALEGERVIQIGGNATVGRGLCRLVVKA